MTADFDQRGSWDRAATTKTFAHPLALELLAKYAALGEKSGVFVTDDGARVRHHSLEWLDELFAGFSRLEGRDAEVVTMNGHRSSAVQWILRK